MQVREVLTDNRGVSSRPSLRQHWCGAGHLPWPHTPLYGPPHQRQGWALQRVWSTGIRLRASVFAFLTSQIWARPLPEASRKTR